MGLLNHFFGSTESVTHEMQLDEEAILRHWKNYLATISKKKDLIEKIDISRDFQNGLNELIRLLDLELVDISGEEKEESEIIYDLELMEHSKRVKRVYKLEQCLGYAETKFEYVYHLLHQLHSFLKYQMHIVNKLLAGSKNTEKLISQLNQQLELELEIIKKISRSKEVPIILSNQVYTDIDSGETKMLGSKIMERGSDLLIELVKKQDK